MQRTALVTLMLALLPLGLLAEDPEHALARKTIERLAPGAELESVRASEVPGMLELVVNGEVVYLSADGRHLFQGQLVDTASASNLSERRRESLRAERIAAAPKNIRISLDAPEEAHRLTVFTAFDCGYCRRFHEEVDAYLAAGISVDYVLLPLAGEGTDVDRSSAAAHCADDRRSALDRAMRGETLAVANCPSGYQAGKELARALGIQQTPTFVAPGGQRLRYLPPGEMREALDSALAGR